MTPSIVRFLLVCSLGLFLMACGGQENRPVATMEPTAETAVADTAPPNAPEPPATATASPAHRSRNRLGRNRCCHDDGRALYLHTAAATAP